MIVASVSLWPTDIQHCNEKELYESGALFPRLSRLRHISSLIAAQIIEAALRDNLCSSGSLPVFYLSLRAFDSTRAHIYDRVWAPKASWGCACSVKTLECAHTCDPRTLLELIHCGVGIRLRATNWWNCCEVGSTRRWMRPRWHGLTQARLASRAHRPPSSPPGVLVQTLCT